MKLYNSTIKPFGFWMKLRLLFVAKQSNWGHDERIVTVFKVDRKGVMYIYAQEPIAYGDPRNAQIDRLGL